MIFPHSFLTMQCLGVASRQRTKKHELVACSPPSLATAVVVSSEMSLLLIDRHKITRDYVRAQCAILALYVSQSQNKTCQRNNSAFYVVDKSVSSVQRQVVCSSVLATRHRNGNLHSSNPQIQSQPRSSCAISPLIQSSSRISEAQRQTQFKTWIYSRSVDPHFNSGTAQSLGQPSSICPLAPDLFLLFHLQTQRPSSLVRNETFLAAALKHSRLVSLTIVTLLQT